MVNFASDEIPPSQPPRWDAGERAWVLTRYAHALDVLRSPDARVIEGDRELQKMSRRLGAPFPELAAVLAGMLVCQNPPRHAHSRASLKPVIARIGERWTADAVGLAVLHLLSGIGEGACEDAIARLADALPNAVMADAIDLEVAEVEWLRREGAIVARAWRRPLAVREYPPIEASAARVRRFLAARGVCSPASRRIAAPYAPEGPSLSEEVGPGDDTAIFFLLMAGVENSAAFLGNALHLLALDPALQQALRDRPDRVDGFVEEALRCHGPLKRLAPRTLERDLTLDGVTIQAGSVLTIRPDSANRDPDAFPDPDRFDLERKSPPPISFSAGAHACMGSMLARLEARVLIGHLLERFEVAPGDAPPRRAASRDFHRLESLRLAFTPVAASLRRRA